MKLKDFFASDKRCNKPLDNLSKDFTCCGKHEVCEHEGLFKSRQKEIEYYDDDELDSFVGRDSHSYTRCEIAKFAEIIHTLWKSDVQGWLQSLQIREIELPDELKDEVISIIDS